MIKQEKEIPSYLMKLARQYYGDIEGIEILGFQWEEKHLTYGRNVPEVSMIGWMPGAYLIHRTIVLDAGLELNKRRIMKKGGNENEFKIKNSGMFDPSFPDKLQDMERKAGSEKCKKLIEEIIKQDSSRQRIISDLAFHALFKHGSEAPEYEPEAADMKIDHMSIDRWLLKNIIENKDEPKEFLQKSIHSALEEDQFDIDDLEPAGIRHYVDNDGEWYHTTITSIENQIVYGYNETVPVLLSMAGSVTFDGMQMRFYFGLTDNIPKTILSSLPGKRVDALIKTGNQDLNDRIILSIDPFDPYDDQAGLIITVESRLVPMSDLNKTL